MTRATPRTTRGHVPRCSRVPFAWSATVAGTFNSLSKVLSTFPSRYLCAIVFGEIFSLRRNLPPTLTLPSQGTRLVGARSYAGGLSVLHGHVTRCTASFQRPLTHRPANQSPTHYTPSTEPGSQSGLYPVHSPLLGVFMLVSLPPLTYMLKFSGLACPRSDWSSQYCITNRQAFTADVVTSPSMVKNPGLSVWSAVCSLVPRSFQLSRGASSRQLQTGWNAPQTIDNNDPGTQ